MQCSSRGDVCRRTPQHGVSIMHLVLTDSIKKSPLDWRQYCLCYECSQQGSPQIGRACSESVAGVQLVARSAATRVGPAAFGHGRHCGRKPLITVALPDLTSWELGARWFSTTYSRRMTQPSIERRFSSKSQSRFQLDFHTATLSITIS